MEDEAGSSPTQDALVAAPLAKSRGPTRDLDGRAEAETDDANSVRPALDNLDSQTNEVAQTAFEHSTALPAPTVKLESTSPTTLEHSGNQPQVKLEPSPQSPAYDNLIVVPQRLTPNPEDPVTLSTIEDMKNEHGLRASKGKDAVANDEEADTKPVMKVKKKGVARKPSAKKQKTEPKNAKKRSSPAPSVQSSASLTKARVKSINGIARGNSKSGTPFTNSSPAPAGSDEEEEGSDSDSGSDQVYCICRKRDDHSWMIACDGGCDDWFHGKCVNMKEADGPLIDKYICPNCQKTGDAVTTWKPMCRYEGCRRPARLSKNSASKYCSDECGVKFMQAMTRRAAGVTQSPRRSQARKRKAVPHDDGARSSDEDEAGPRGGPLRLSQLKALTSDIVKASDFRSLGSTAISSAIDQSGSDEALSDGDRSRIEHINEEKGRLRDRMSSLKAREKFIAFTKEQVNKYAEKENIKPRDVCGFDSRLSWTTEEIAKQQTGGERDLNGVANGDDVVDGEDGGTAHQINGTSNGISDDEWAYFCARKRCDKHKQWQKVQLSDVRFDEAELADRMRALDREEGDIRERAVLRQMQAGVANGMMGNSVEVLAA